MFSLWLHLFILSGVISPLFSSSILGTYQPRELIFQCPIFLPFQTVYGILKARILKWFAITAIPFSSQFSSVTQSCPTLCDPMKRRRQASLSITISRSSLRLTSIKSVMPSTHLILSRPLLLLTSIPPSVRVLSNESTLCMRWPKYWSFIFSIIPSKEIPGLISSRMEDLLAVQGTL